MGKSVLIVEDQFIEANNLKLILQRAGYDVLPIANSVSTALEILSKYRASLVLIDIYLKGTLTGIDLAIQLSKMDIGFVYLSANSTQSILEAAKKTQPYGFLVKPFREKDVLITIDIAQYLHEQRHLSTILKKSNKVSDSGDSKIIGTSKSLLESLNLAYVVAPSDVSVLILGESGTGKERFAEEIHLKSERAKQPIIRVNCATLPPNLVESELFGHEKGSFTGAFERRIGKFEQAQNGTIFLDEIGELPITMQAKLLHVLQERKIDRIGGKSSIDIDVRIIAATNRNLEKEVSEGKFRVDLYYRLNVFPIKLPPLRERKGDIPKLAYHFMKYYSLKFGKNVNEISESALNQLELYEWPGNIRELQHLIERTVILSKAPTINNFFFNGEIERETNVPSPGTKTIQEVERDHIIDVLKKCNGKISGKAGAAELLAINASTLVSRMKKLGIDQNKIFK
jgi:two-component system response regulator HydG